MIRSEYGFTLVEMTVALALLGALAYFASYFSGGLSLGTSTATNAVQSLQNLTLPLSTLKKDLQAAKSVVLVTPSVNPRIKITLGSFASLPAPSITLKNIYYTITSGACPGTGAVNCKVLTRTEGSAAGPPRVTFEGLAAIDWCLYNSAAVTGFDRCDTIPKALAPITPVDGKRFAILFQTFSSIRTQSSQILTSVVDLENVPYNASSKVLEVIKAQ